MVMENQFLKLSSTEIQKKLSKKIKNRGLLLSLIVIYAILNSLFMTMEFIPYLYVFICTFLILLIVLFISIEGEIRHLKLRLYLSEKLEKNKEEIS